jgi:DsbC/DsbD-like thiol-disulfide interchange protein
MSRVSFAIFCVVIGFAFAACKDIHEAVHLGNESARPSSSATQAGISSSADVVKVRTAEVSVPADGSADATVTLSISSGYHVNANPATFSYLIPTAISPNKTEGITAGKPVYPVATKKKFQFAEEPLAVYEGEVQIKLPLQADKGLAKPGRLPIKVTVQACDSEKCYAPATLDAVITVK